MIWTKFSSRFVCEWLFFRIVQILIEVRGTTYDALELNPQDMSTRAYNVAALKHKVAFLLNMVSYIRSRFISVFFYSSKTLMLIKHLSDCLDTRAVLPIIIRWPRSWRTFIFMTKRYACLSISRSRSFFFFLAFIWRRQQNYIFLPQATEEITKKNTTKESSTQLRADSTSTTEDLGQFGVTTCQDLFLTRA